MHVEFLVEEPSAEAALREFLSSLLGAENTFRIHAHQGKRDLLNSLAGRLRGYSKWLPDDWRIVVLVDRDAEDCRRLKRRLNRLAKDAGLKTRADARSPGIIRVLNRIALEELEAWFFGDTDAIRAAYPRIPSNLSANARYRDPDAIRGGTWEALERVLQDAGYHKGGLPKIEAARRIAHHLRIENNRSVSFRAFCSGVRSLL